MWWRVIVSGLCCLSGEVWALGSADKKATSTITTVTDPVGAGDFAQVILGLGLVVFAILAMAWIIKRTGHVNTRMHGSLKVLGGLSLTQRERILLIQVGAKQLLIGVSPGRITTLHELENNIEMNPEQNRPNGSFAQRLQEYMRGHKDA